MSKTERIAIIRARFAALHCLAAAAATAETVTVAPLCANVHALPAWREPILTPMQRATLSAELAAARQLSTQLSTELPQ